MLQPLEKNIMSDETRSTFSEMERKSMQDVFERMQLLGDVLSHSFQAELQRVSEVIGNLDTSVIARMQEQARIISESPYLNEVRRVSEIVNNIDFEAATRLQELTRDWAEPLNNIQNLLGLYSNKIAEINMAMSPLIEGLNTRVLEIQKAISDPLAQVLENYQQIFCDPFNGLFPVGFFKEISQQEKFVEYCRENGWVPHPVLYSFYGDDFFSLTETEKVERIKDDREEFNSRMWDRIPRNVMVNGREDRIRQIFNSFKIDSYTPVCRSVFPEIESLTRDYIRSDSAFINSLKQLSKPEKKRVVSQKINTILKIDKSPILSLYITELGGLLGYRTVEILLTVTRAEYIPFEETGDDLSMNRHFHAHGEPFNATFKHAVNALFLLDIAIQSFSALKSRIEEEESVSECN